MAKSKSKSNAFIFEAIALIAGILAIVMFSLAFIKITAEVSALQTTITTKINGWSVVFGGGKANVVTKVGDKVSKASGDVDVKTSIVNLIQFIALAVAVVFGLLAFFTPKKYVKITYFIMFGLYAVAFVLAILTKNGYMAANEGADLLKDNTLCSMGVCFSGAFALIGALVSLLCVKKVK